MNVHGAHDLASPPEEVFEAIRDTRVLMAVIPGCETVERVAPYEYVGWLSLRLPGTVGRYRTTVRLVDATPPERAGLDGRVEGPLGSLVGRADFELVRRADGGTTLEWRGTAVIQGPLARLDSRFVEQLASSLVRQGLGALDRHLAPAMARATAARAPLTRSSTEVAE